MPVLALVLAASALALAQGRQLTPPKKAHRRQHAQKHAQYFWPTSRGKVGSYGNTEYDGPSDWAHSLAWQWHHPAGRYNTITIGVLIDDKKNIYLAADDAIRKFNEQGEMLWSYTPQSSIPTNPCLSDGTLYGSTRSGQVFALDMGTGKQLWAAQAGEGQSAEASSIQAMDGVVIAGGNPNNGTADTTIFGLSAEDGRKLWSFNPDSPVVNFMPLSAGDGTFVYQDVTGKAYRHKVKDGSVVWKAGGRPASWTNAGAMLGPNGLVYAVSLHGCCCGSCKNTDERTTGDLSAYSLQDGSLVWRKRTRRPPNAYPVVGQLSMGAGLSVVMAQGQHCHPFGSSGMSAYDAATGAEQWHFTAGRNPHMGCAGDLEGEKTRVQLGIRPACRPPPWSAPTIDARGVIYAGNQDGQLYAIEDLDGDGKFQGKQEVKTLDTLSAFNTPGSAHAPGMLAIASCDGLYVFHAE